MTEQRRWPDNGPTIENGGMLGIGPTRDLRSYAILRRRFEPDHRVAGSRSRKRHPRGFRGSRLMAGEGMVIITLVQARSGRF